jgi:hypothetical protein
MSQAPRDSSASALRYTMHVRWQPGQQIIDVVDEPKTVPRDKIELRSADVSLRDHGVEFIETTPADGSQVTV